jgi:hypothetical protein
MADEILLKIIDGGAVVISGVVILGVLFVWNRLVKGDQQSDKDNQTERFALIKAITEQTTVMTEQTRISTEQTGVISQQSVTLAGQSIALAEITQTLIELRNDLQMQREETASVRTVLNQLPDVILEKLTPRPEEKPDVGVTSPT